ncbi:nicotinate-nucleotide adenylyltransferase [Aquicella lusitana]|uniref:Probable nicotinate-nucleotide adenylyltransferase n=1 Tax=Aquicella lusitana TaxID=254246 RepID=A0A370GGA7_9COXI|nr:nicotinate-nucleotide adenylyltransferase [Aquicella lusitana]RDI42828.1 nicotinate-nucleotide adenylyltransferase [Aquicella lusitana]VVC73071.1 putative nicotinate-nucleotide adenylyltransferase [Aquicella lusitana]
MHQTHKAIGILGGTFDPIHLGHLRMAIELYEALDLAKIHIIPCFQPVHRKLPVASPEQRLAMVQCAVKDEPALFADDREIRRKGLSYMIDTLMEMRSEMPGTPLALLVGIDAFLGFPSWHRWMEILDQAHIIVAHRPNYQLPPTGLIADLISERLQHEIAFIHENQAGGILLRPITSLDISATDIRKQIAMGRNPRYLLPDNVYHYIKQHGTYSIVGSKHEI